MLVVQPAHAMDYSALYTEFSPAVVIIRTLSRNDIVMDRMSGSGVESGFLIEPDLIMTAAHVVDEAQLIRVVFKDGPQISTQVIASIENSDAARQVRQDQGYQMRVFRHGEFVSLTASANKPLAAVQ